MVTEADYGQRIYFIDGEELSKFAASDMLQINGYGYEWEDEEIVHLHFEPLHHSFGRQHKVSFSKPNGVHEADASICVDIDAEGLARVGEVAVTNIPSRKNLYKRNQGLIELDILANKRVLIIGLGSGGSRIAVELAKAGVGQFAIMDFDRVELHNLSRHICTVNDLGRLKTDAVSDAIKGKNPYAIVDKLPVDVNKNQDILEAEIEKADLVMCCTDNNMSRFVTSEFLSRHNKVGIFGRAITRAEGGDIFIYRPGEACHFCLLGSGWFDPTAEEITNLDSAKRSGQIPAYMTEDDAEALVQVGLAADIEPINNMAVKLALVELSRGTNSGIASLEEEFTANYYIWANRRDRSYASWGRFGNRQNLPTIMRWYGVNVPRDPECTLCGSKRVIHYDDSSMDLLNTMGSGDLSDLTLPELQDN